MATLITITLPNDCSDHMGEIKNTQKTIVNYFGNHHAYADENYPTVYLNGCSINEADLNELYKNSYKGMILTIIINNDSKQRQGDFIYLKSE